MPERWSLTPLRVNHEGARHRTMASNPRVLGALEQALVELSEQPSEKGDRKSVV